MWEMGGSQVQSEGGREIVCIKSAALTDRYMYRNMACHIFFLITHTVYFAIKFLYMIIQFLSFITN